MYLNPRKQEISKITSMALTSIFVAYVNTDNEGTPWGVDYLLLRL
jgi:hypothetical protein